MFFLFIFAPGNLFFGFLNTQEIKFLLCYLILLVLMASVRALHGGIRTKDPKFLLFLIYGFLHVGMLMPLRLKALLTLKDNTRGTRAVSTPRKVYLNFALWLSCSAICVFGITAMIAAFTPDSILSNSADPALPGRASLWNFMVSFWTSLSYAALPFPALILLFTGLALYDRYRNLRQRSLLYRRLRKRPRLRG